MNQIRIVAIVILALTVAGGVVYAEDVSVGKPDLSATVSENQLRAGETTALNVTIRNEATVRVEDISSPPEQSGLSSQFTTARGVVVVAEDGRAPITVHTNSRTLGALPDGGSATLPFRITVDADAEADTYSIPVRVRYSYIDVQRDGDLVDATERKRLRVEVEVTEAPRFEITDVQSDVRVASSGTVAVSMENVGSGAANDATVTLTSTNGDVTLGQGSTVRQYVDRWRPGEDRTLTFPVRATASADAAPYAFTIQTTYERDDGAPGVSETRTFNVEPMPRQEFSVVATDSTVRIGDDGLYSVTLRNDGPITVRDATVRLASQNPPITFGQSAASTQFVGSWAPTETRTLVYDVTATDAAEQRTYALDATIAYEDDDGDQGTAQPLSLGLRPGPEEAFTISDVTSTLRVGEEGTLSGTVTNEKSVPVRSVVLRLSMQSQTITPLETEYAVGDLDPGESASVTFDVEVSDSGQAGPRQFTFEPTYRTQDGDQRRGNSIDVRERIEPARDRFAVDPLNATVRNGETTTVELRVTNRGEETLSDISAKLFADSPISADDDQAYVPSLDPGESTTITFTVGASGAIPKAYPLSVDFQYDDEDGDTFVSDTYRVPITVLETEDRGSPVSLIIVALIVVGAVAGAIFWYRRQ